MLILIIRQGLHGFVQHDNTVQKINSIEDNYHLKGGERARLNVVHFHLDRKLLLQLTDANVWLKCQFINSLT